MKRISMTYGQVLFELGIKKESLQKAQDMLHENEELLSALENPTITKKEKENVDNVDKSVYNFGFTRKIDIFHCG